MRDLLVLCNYAITSRMIINREEILVNTSLGCNELQDKVYAWESNFSECEEYPTLQIEGDHLRLARRCMLSWAHY